MKSFPTTPMAQHSAFIKAIEILSKPSPDVQWLLEAGPIAKRLNAESLNDIPPREREAGNRLPANQ